MSYSEERREKACPACGRLNQIIIAYAGDVRANEHEVTGCYDCGKELETERCFALFSEQSAADAEDLLRRMQNRA